MLTFHQGRLADGTLRYAQVAEVALPSAPTSLAALHFIVPTLAVGCEGRCISSDCKSWMCKLLPPVACCEAKSTIPFIFWQLAASQRHLRSCTLELVMSRVFLWLMTHCNAH